MLLHDEGSYYIETSPLIYRANQWTGFYMIGTSVMKELNWKKTLNHFLVNNSSIFWNNYRKLKRYIKRNEFKFVSSFQSVTTFFDHVFRL